MRAVIVSIAAGMILAACDNGPTSLVSADEIVGDAIPHSLTGEEGMPERGKEIFVAREGGHCVLCHQVSGLDVLFQGDVGPDLSDIGARFSPGQIRLRIVDASSLNADTVMPPYYRVHDLTQVPVAQVGKPVLSVGQIEDLVAYLATLTEPQG